MFRATDYSDDLMGVNTSEPATAPIFRGAAFQHQTIQGVTLLNPGDDRVTFVGEIDYPDEYRQFSQRLPADSDGVGTQVAKGGVLGGGFEQSPNPSRKGNIPARTDAPGSAIPQGGGWYETLRPNAGFPLPVASDIEYADRTDDMMGDPFASRHVHLTVAPGERLIAENPLDYASRLSTPPSTEQAPNRLWDRTLGSWPWSGRKDAMDRPTAQTSHELGPISDRLPSPTGAGGRVGSDQAYNLYPQPLTFRAPPTPWDQGSNSDNGFYVDSGT